MSSIPLFDPSLFNSYDRLKNSLIQSDAITQVLSKKDKQYSKVQYPYNPTLSFGWNACQIATAPFRWIFAIFARIVGKTASGLGATHYGKQLKTCAQYLEIGFALYSTDSTKCFRIKKGS